MVLVNRKQPLDLASLPPDDPDPGSDDVELRMRVISNTVKDMEENEKAFFTGKTVSGFQGFTGYLSKPSSSMSQRSSRTAASLRSECSHGRKSDSTLLNNSAAFTQKNSAMSSSFSSPRQYTLSATSGTKNADGLVNHIRQSTVPSIKLNGLATRSTTSFDYDEHEEIPLEMVKTHRSYFRRYVIETNDIYTRACSYLGITASQTYVKQVTSRTTTRVVSMGNTSLSHFTVKPIAISLVRDHIIHTLDLSGNDIGSLGVIYIAQMLAVNDTITELNLSSTNPGRVGLEALAVHLPYNTSLNILRLECNSIDHTETDVIVEIISGSKGLVELYLGHNSLGYDGASHLAQELVTNKTLSTLDLQWNHFRKKSASHLCNAIKENTGLRNLNLSWNGLGKEGCAALAIALPKNSSLKHLDLTNNRIDVVALPFLLHGLVRNSGLESLHLAKNPMTTGGVKAVVRAITGAPSIQLRYLNIEDIPVDKDFTNLVNTMKNQRNIGVDHGPEMYSAVEMTMQEHDPHDLNRFDPVMVIVEYMRIDNLRLIDLFQYFDTTGRGMFSRSDLRMGVATLGLPLTEHHLDCIMKDVDKKKDGYIDLEEFMWAHRDMSKTIIQRTTRAKKKGKEDLGLKELRQILKELVVKRNNKNKEKAMNKLASAVNAAVSKGKASKRRQSNPDVDVKIKSTASEINDDLMEKAELLKAFQSVLSRRQSRMTPLSETPTTGEHGVDSLNLSGNPTEEMQYLNRNQTSDLQLLSRNQSTELTNSSRLSQHERPPSITHESPLDDTMKTFRLPEVIKQEDELSHEFGEGFTKVDNYLNSTLGTNSTNEVAILGSPIIETDYKSDNDDDDNDDDGYEDDYNDDDFDDNL